MSAKNGRFKSNVKSAAAGRWHEIVPSLASIPVSALDGRHQACPRCGGDNGSDRFRVFGDFAETGGMICNQCFPDRNGDGFAALQWLNGWDFKTALAQVASHLGIEPPAAAAGKEKASPDEHLAWLPWSDPIVYWWARNKAGLTPESVRANGGHLARYRGQFTVIAIPIYGPQLAASSPVGWAMWNTQGPNPNDPTAGMLPVFATKPPTWQKMKTASGSERGLIGSHGLERIRNADVVWKVEGPGDLLALWQIVPAELRDRHVVITNSAGANENPQQWMVDLVAGKTVHVVHDADIPGQFGSQALKERGEAGGAEKWAGRFARSAEAVRNVQLPYTVAPTKGKDLRDWINEGGTFEQLLALAESTADAEAAPLVVESIDDPHRLARAFLKTSPHFRYWREGFYAWESPAYRFLPKSEIVAAVTDVIKSEFDEYCETRDEPDNAPRKVKKSLIGDVLNAISSLTFLRDDADPPFWLRDGGKQEPAAGLIVTSDSILRPDRVGGDMACTSPPDPQLFTVNPLAYSYSPAADCPNWLEFIYSIWGDEHDQIATLQEMMGYLLLPETWAQKMFMLIGPKRSGKGTIARVIRGLVGERNVCAPTLGGLQGEFGMQPLLGKTVAIVGDARLSGRADEGVIVERLLSVTGEDAQTINRKHQQHVTAQLKTRFVLLSNELPRLRDASATLPSRLILLRFTESFYGREDHGLTERLTAELPGILNWSIVGWKRLRDRGHFVQPAESQEVVEEMEEMSSPITAFVRDCCDVGPTLDVEKNRLFEEWERWCKRKNHHVGTDSMFGRNLTAAFSHIIARRPRINGKRVHLYSGIAVQVENWADHPDRTDQSGQGGQGGQG